MPHLLRSVAYPETVVAPSDASSESKDAADYVCTGTDDELVVQDAIDSLSAGGLMVLAPGTFNFGGRRGIAGPRISKNLHYGIYGFGATILLAPGATGFKVSQGVSAAEGVTIVGMKIDGQSNAGTTGVEFEDTNNGSLIEAAIKGCTTGVMLRSNAAGNFVEGTLIDNVLLRDNTTGIAFRIVSGTGSFAQTMVRGLKCVVGASGIGIDLDANCILQRSWVQGTFWIDSNETALDLDGNIEDTTFITGIEGSGGATGNVGLLIGTNATNTDQAFFKLLFTGTIATQVTANSKNFHYWSGGSQFVDSAGTATLGIKRHGDTTDRIRFSGPTAGGKIDLGNGTLLDAGFFRSAAAVVGITSTLEFTEIAAPANGAANTGRLFVKDNGAGKTQLCVRFASGAEIVLATEV